MLQPKETTALDLSKTDVVRSAPHDTMTTVSRQASTKDAGRGQIGGGMMRFHTTKDAGRVHVGGGMMRF